MMNRKSLSVEVTSELRPGKEQPCAKTRGLMKCKGPRVRGLGKNQEEEEIGRFRPY